MKITRAEQLAILLTGIVLAFVAGFFLGRCTAPAQLQLESGGAVVSPALLSPAPESAEADSAETDSAAENSAETGSAAEDSLIEDSAAETAPSSGLLNLNTATKEQLEELPGIGEVLAQRILDYRETYGDFSSVEELLNVSGIGDKIFSEIHELVEVGN